VDDLRGMLDELRRVTTLIDEALDQLRASSRDYADAEHAYRQARAKAWLAARGTVNERESMVELRCGDLRYARDLADGLRSASVEAIRSRRAQLSALQSVLAASRAEVELARTGISPSV
jgi:hypothetical protein